MAIHRQPLGETLSDHHHRDDAWHTTCCFLVPDEHEIHSTCCQGSETEFTEGVDMSANPYVQGWRELDERYADLVLGKRN